MDESKEAQLRNMAHRLRTEAELLNWLLTRTSGETPTCGKE